MGPGPGRALRVLAPACAAALVLAGCGGDEPIYVMLQKSMQQTIKREDGRTVTQINCTPHRKDVSFHDGYVHESCHMTFADGGSYTTDATIEQRDYAIAAYNFHWDSPGPLDITTAPLPAPARPGSSDEPGSLFRAANLRPALAAVAAHVGPRELVLRAAIYPDELLAVVGGAGTARLITVHAGGASTIGPPTSFTGSRAGASPDQLPATVPQRTIARLVAHAHLAPGAVTRFVLGSVNRELDWTIATSAGRTFRVFANGTHLAELHTATSIG